MNVGTACRPASAIVRTSIAGGIIRRSPSDLLQRWQ